MSYPETYYDALRALTAKGATLGHREYELRHVIPDVLDALGYEIPAPVLDDHGKPLRVWRFSIASALPADLSEQYRRRSQALAKERRQRWDYEVDGLVVAASKAAALDAAYGPDRSSWRRPKTTEVGEVGPDSLDYEAATQHPGMLVAISPDGEYVPIPLPAKEATR